MSRIRAPETVRNLGRALMQGRDRLQSQEATMNNEPRTTGLSDPQSRRAESHRRARRNGAVSLRAMAAELRMLHRAHAAVLVGVPTA